MNDAVLFRHERIYQKEGAYGTKSRHISEFRS